MKNNCDIPSFDKFVMRQSHTRLVGFVIQEDYVYELSFGQRALSVKKLIPIPCTPAQTRAGCTPKAQTFIPGNSLRPEHFDLTENYFAVLSPVDCQAVEGRSGIGGASVRVYDLEESNSGQSRGRDNFARGWSCVDIPSSLQWQKDLAKSWEHT